MSEKPLPRESSRDTRLPFEIMTWQWEEHRRQMTAFRDLILDVDQVLEPVKTNNELFMQILRLAFGVYNVKQAEFAAGLKVSRAAVSRWIGGQSLPAPYVRPALVEALAGLLTQGLNRLAGDDVREPSDTRHRLN